MSESQIVLIKIGMMFLVMMTGWWARRRGYLDAGVCRALGAVVVQVSFPALVFTQMLSTASPASLRQDWWVPLLAVATLLLAGAIGHLWGAWFGVGAEQRSTFTFTVGLPNWVFLPLPIAEALYGAEGVRLVLWFNVGAQAILWTAGVRLLTKGEAGASAWRSVLLNPGILATVAGSAVALAWPGIGSGATPERGWAAGLLAGMGGGALQMLGSLTIPLSLLVTGAQLGAPSPGRAGSRTLAALVAGRLVVAPVVTLLLIRAVARAWGLSLPSPDFITLAVIVAMPVGVSSTMFIERFGGDAALSASGIFYTTLLSLVSVPVVVLVCRAWT